MPVFCQKSRLTGLIHLRVKNHLGYAANIPEVNEQDITMVPDGVHPTHKQDIPALMGRGQFTAIDSLFPIHKNYLIVVRNASAFPSPGVLRPRFSSSRRIVPLRAGGQPLVKGLCLGDEGIKVMRQYLNKSEYPDCFPLLQRGIEGDFSNKAWTFLRVCQCYKSKHISCNPV